MNRAGQNVPVCKVRLIDVFSALAWYECMDAKSFKADTEKDDWNSGRHLSKCQSSQSIILMNRQHPFPDPRQLKYMIDTFQPCVMAGRPSKGHTASRNDMISTTNNSAVAT